MAPAAHRRGTHCTRLPQTSGQLQGTCRREGWIGGDGHRCTCQERRQKEWRGVYKERQKGVDVLVKRGGRKNGQGCIERDRVDRGHQGTYSCVAEDEAGRTTYNSVQLRVMDRGR